VWRALTGLDLIARWLLPNDFRLEAGHRFAVDGDPIRRWGLRGTGHCEVLAFDEGKMLRIAPPRGASARYAPPWTPGALLSDAPGGASRRHR